MAGCLSRQVEGGLHKYKRRTWGRPEAGSEQAVGEEGQVRSGTQQLYCQELSVFSKGPDQDGIVADVQVATIWSEQVQDLQTERSTDRTYVLSGMCLSEGHVCDVRQADSRHKQLQAVCQMK